MAKRLVDIKNPSDFSLQEVTIPFLNSSMNQSRVRKLPIAIDEKFNSKDLANTDLEYGSPLSKKYKLTLNIDTPN